MSIKKELEGFREDFKKAFDKEPKIRIKSRNQLFITPIIFLICGFSIGNSGLKSGLIPTILIIILSVSLTGIVVVLYSMVRSEISMAHLSTWKIACEHFYEIIGKLENSLINLKKQNDILRKENAALKEELDM